MASDIRKVAALSASEIGLAFRSGEADPVALTEHLLERIGATADTNIFISVTADRARKEALAASARYAVDRPLSALDGVPVAWKDLFDVAGTRTTAGSSLFRDAEIRKKDLACVANVAAAGLVCLGKLNLTEFAYSGLGLNPHFGTPVNPNDKKVHRSPGGSSSGSGAAVAAGLSPCAIGTDTGGSVRIPASLNGVYGYKTSEGRIDKEGMFVLSPTLDTIGPLARSVSDCILLDQLLRGAATTNVRRRGLDALRLVVPENFVLDECDEKVVENFERSLRLLEASGARIERRRIREFDDYAAVTRDHGSLLGAEAYHVHRDLVESEAGKKIDARVVHRLMLGRRMSAHDLLSVQDVRRETSRAMTRLLDGALMAMPTTPIVAPEVGPLEADPELFHRVNLKMLRNTTLGNFLGFCGLAIPNGRDAGGLPTSILISGRAGDDEVLLGHGLEIDRVLQGSFDPTWKHD